MPSLDFVPAVRLLPHWGPRDASTGDPAFAADAVYGSLPDPEEWSWSVSPAPEQFDIGEARHVVAVDALNHAIDGPDEWTATREATEVAADVRVLFCGLLGSDLGEPARELIEAIALELADYCDLVRLTVATEPGGEPLPGELHLLGRDLSGDTVRVWLTASTAAANVAEQATYAAAVLGEYVWVTNNDRMRVDVDVETHGLGRDLREASFQSWWPSSESSAKLAGDFWDDEPAIGLLDDDTLATVRADFTRHNLDNARSGAWAMELIGDYDIDSDPQPPFPGDRLVELLTEEIFNGVITRVGPIRLAYGIGFPVEGDEDGVLGALLFVGAERVGVVAISAVA